MNAIQIKKPDIFSYSDYQVFLQDWLEYKKNVHAKFSMRGLAREAGLATGYLPMILGKKRHISPVALQKILPLLGLSVNEQSFLEALVTLGATESNDHRVAALEKMSRFEKYRLHNQQDSDAFEYLKHWYYVAIREMAALENFVADAETIQARLRYALPLQEVRGALEFLFKNGYLIKNEDQSVSATQKDIDCSGGIYRVALANFHREIFRLAALSIERATSQEREIQGYTCSLTEENFEQAKKIMHDALTSIRQLGEKENHKGSVYQLEVALFPLTHGVKK